MLMVPGQRSMPTSWTGEESLRECINRFDRQMIDETSDRIQVAAAANAAN
jgi:hypothetical protein